MNLHYDKNYFIFFFKKKIDFELVWISLLNLGSNSIYKKKKSMRSALNDSFLMQHKSKVVNIKTLWST